jgi:hypothetical protein
MREDGVDGRGAVGGSDGAPNGGGVPSSVPQTQFHVVNASQLQWSSQQDVRLAERLVPGAWQVLYVNHRVGTRPWTVQHASRYDD